MNYLSLIFVGAVATAVVDVWGLMRKPLLGWPVADYRLVGRWFAGFPRGVFRHEAIGRSSPARGEALLGWLAHYFTGTVLAAAFLALVGADWLRRPMLAPALLFGLVTVLVPFLVMQPAMGAGFAASRSPQPAAARLQSVVTHLVFGLGLYVAGWAHDLIRIRPTGD